MPTGSIKSCVDDACCRHLDRKTLFTRAKIRSLANSLGFETAPQMRQMHFTKDNFISLSLSHHRMDNKIINETAIGHSENETVF